MGADSETPRVCQRLINIIFGVLPRSVPSRPGSAEADSSRNKKGSSEVTSMTNSSPEIVVEFRHTDGGQLPLHAPKKDGWVLANVKPIPRKAPEKKDNGLDPLDSALRIERPSQMNDGLQMQQKRTQEKVLRELQILSGTVTRFNSPKKNGHAKEKHIHIDNGAVKGSSQRPTTPLPRATLNRNEEFDAFIRSKKKQFHET